MWVQALKVSELEKGTGKVVDLGVKKVALFNVKGKFYALENGCLHRGAPLGNGYLEGCKVTCSWHAWEFDVKTGLCDTMPGAKQPTYPTKIENNIVWIDISSSKS